ncbi:MAG: PorV/PorQ family protein [Elusimicrobia bacterium]|nr:PorV/PorQ family protein [Elusimicrobiota bacterium]
MMPAALAVLLSAATAWAGVGENAGSISAPVLQIPVGARAASLGTAFSAVADDVSTLYYNPAGLTSLHSREASMMFLNGTDLQTTQFFAGATPLPFFTGLSGSGFATIGASFLNTSNGDVVINSLNADGTSAGSREVGAGGDSVLTFGYAERVADTPFETKDSTLHFDHYFGAAGKFVRSTLADSYSAQTWAGDLGYLGRAPELGVSLGASIANLGGSLRYIEDNDPLPLAMRLGAAYQFRMPENHFLQWSTDGQYEYHERLWFISTGVEYKAFKHAALRFGYQLHKELAGLSFGFGLRWRNWGLDYGWNMQDAFGDAHRFSFTFRFGQLAVREREKPRRPFIESVPDQDELPERGDDRPSTYDQPQRPRRRAPDPQGAPGWIY